jgi:peptidoglycan/LPS O-acetylase OafA/YrhL
MALRSALSLALVSVLLRVCLYHTGATEDRVYNGFDTRADGLLIGCALALGRPFKVAVWAGRLWPIPIIAIAIIFVFIPWSHVLTLTSTIIAWASAWLILPLWAQTHHGLAKVLEFRPVRYVGRIFVWAVPLALAYPLTPVGITFRS